MAKQMGFSSHELGEPKNEAQIAGKELKIFRQMAKKQSDEMLNRLKPEGSILHEGCNRKY